MGMQTEMTTRRDARARRTLVGAPTMAVPALAAVPALVMALVVLLTPLQAAPAAAQGWIQTLPDRPGSGVVKLRTDVRVTVTGRIAEVEVEEWFENRGGGLGEGDYLYPLPGGAVFSNFSLYQGDQELTGETMAAEDARGIYEEIVRRQKDPALIELVGHGLVRARVFPIEPGDRRRITLRYTQVLDRAGDALQFRYAAGSALSGPGTVPGPVVRPVPLPRPRTVPDTIPGSPNVRAEGDRSAAPPRHVAPIRFTLTADAGEFRRPFSPTHDLEVDERGGMLRVRPRSDLRGDFSVFLPLEGGLIGMTLATHRPATEDGYFMLTLSPGEAGPTATPRDVAAVVDVSGSMSGQKIEQTREALHQLLGSLRSGDRFRLIAFNNRVTASSEEWTRADADGVRAARQWVDRLRAGGGTNVADALDEALRLGSPDGRLPIVVFLTDGQPTVGERNPERIAATAEAGRGRARVFAFGVGYDVNTYLLDRLGQAGRGSTAYVEPGENVESAVATLATRITHPVLVDLEIDDVPVRLTEVYPGELPDLFAGEELVLLGRYEGSGDGVLRIRGRRSGDTERFAIDAGFPARADANDFIPRLWASRKLGELTRQVRLNGPEPELVDAIRQTALRYGLLSEYTSYLVQEPGALADGGADGRRLMLREADAITLDALVVTTAPAAATGQAAVQASERSRVMREATSATAVREAEEAMAQGAVAAGMRVVAGRTFTLDEEFWIDVTVDDDAPVARIQRFSDAYFALLRAAPELRPVVAELSAVRLAGAGITLEIGDEGDVSLSPRALSRLVAEFRGR